MTRDWALRWLFFLVGAAAGALAEGVQWTFWAAWAGALGSLYLIAHWHSEETSHA